MKEDKRDNNGGATFLISIVAILLTVVLALAGECRRLSNELEIRHEPDTVYVENTWQRLIGAIMLVESEGNPLAVNEDTGATGCLQLMKVYVDEANRILGEERYSYDDRLDPEKSVEMFNIVQDKHNPTHDLRRATYLHNKPEWYHNRVMKKMEEI